MPAHITLVDDRPEFLTHLAECLRADGHEVRVFEDLSVAIPPARTAIELQLAVVRPPKGHGGLRITVLAAPQSYTGARMKLMVDPISVDDVIAALHPLLSAYAATLVDRRRARRGSPGDAQA